LISTNITDILKTFSEDEIKKFKSFIASPYYNKNKNVNAFFDQIIKFHPEYNSVKLSKLSVFEKIFGKSKYNDGLIRSLSFNLNNLLKNFLIDQKNANEDLKNELLLLEEYNRRKLNKHFLKKFEELNDTLNNRKNKDEIYYECKVKMQRQMDYFVEINRFNQKDYNVFKNYSISSMSENLSFYICHLVISNNSLIFEETDESSNSLDSDLIKYIFKEILSEKSKYKENTLINHNRLQILINRERKEEHYQELKKIFLTGFDLLDHFERYNIHNLLQHFCIDKIFEGKAEYRKERFELYKASLDQKLFSLYEDEYFNDMLFGNIVIVAIAVSEIDWLEDFIKQYIPLLSPDVKDTIEKYSTAKVSFAKKNYQETLIHLNTIENSNYVRNETSLRDLKMMSLYELGLFNELHYQFDAYNHFLKKNKKLVTGLRFTRIKNFLKYFQMLLKANERSDKKIFTELQYELNENPNVMERRWLLSKLSEIKI